jgi:carbonic anhydrase
MSQINGFVGRRLFLKFAGVGGFTIAATAACGNLLRNTSVTAAPEPTLVAASVKNPAPVSADEAVKELLAGNKRFVDQKREYPDQSLERLRLVAKGQYPFASILGCADSRVPAEMIFDQGLGDLFVIRVAGNVAGDTAIGSLEYSTAVLGCQLIMVLGHSKCGAVTEALKEDPAPGRISFILEEIRPALGRLKSKSRNLQEAIVANVQYQAEELLESSVILANLVREGKLKIVGGLYDIDTGKVSIVNI